MNFFRLILASLTSNKSYTFKPILYITNDEACSFKKIISQHLSLSMCIYGIFFKAQIIFTLPVCVTPSTYFGFIVCVFLRKKKKDHSFYQVPDTYTKQGKIIRKNLYLIIILSEFVSDT